MDEENNKGEEIQLSSAPKSWFMDKIVTFSVHMC